MTRPSVVFAAAATTLVVSTTAFAEIPTSSVTWTSSTATVTAATARPGAALGVADPEAIDEDTGALLLARALLFVPRWTWRVLLFPVEGLLYLYDRFDVQRRFEDIFFDRERVFGIYPTALVETGFGLTAGLRVVHDDLFGRGEKLRVALGFGGRFNQRYTASFESGRRFGDDFSVELTGGFEAVPRVLFFGIGNAPSLTDPASLGSELIDPFASDVAVQTRLSRDVARAELRFTNRFSDRWSARLRGGWRYDSYDRAVQPGDVDALDVYDPVVLLAENDFDELTAELQIQYDSRRYVGPFGGDSLPSTGMRLTGFAAINQVISDKPNTFARYGFEAVRDFDLYRGDRVITLRAYAEGVTGELEKIPFIDLPWLGGNQLLRGHLRGRFSDRIATLVSAEYRFPLTTTWATFLFVDAGRVFRELDELTLEGWRGTFGGGLQLFSGNSVIARLYGAWSTDGPFFGLELGGAWTGRPSNER